MIDEGFRGMKLVSDLNDGLLIGQNSGLDFAGDTDVYWQDAVRPTHGFSSLEDLPSHCRSLQRRLLRQVLDVCRAVPGDGLRATDLPGKSAGYRGLPVGAIVEALPHGIPPGDQTLDLGRRQRNSGLAHPCGICPAPDRAGPETLRGREPGLRTGRYCLRAGFQPSICVCRCFPGRCFVPPSRP